MKKIYYILIITLVISWIFIICSDVDIMMSSLFYSKNGKEFFLINNHILRNMNYLVYCIAFTLITYYSAIILMIFIKNTPYQIDRYKYYIAILLIFFIVSVLLIQIISKNYFSRSRPYQIMEFNGNKRFDPLFVISNQCSLNCSFGSFHASIGMLLLIHLYQNNKNRISKLLLCLLVTLFMLSRIIQGQHFLSDVVMTVCFVLIIWIFISITNDRQQNLR